ncbi:hypothetical protein K3495_g10274 [Podosphaera aphanis]|nr:hypothetical protein K3495_g10274 [Podosphaera aphanis]
MSSKTERFIVSTSSKPLLIDTLINSSVFVQAMVDTGCLCFSVINEDLVRNHDIHTESIPPRYLRLADEKKACKITRVARLKLDIDGHQEQLWGYVMPNLAFQIILGKPWMEKNEVVYSAGAQSLRIGKTENGILVRESRWWEKSAPKELKEKVAGVNLDRKARVSYRVLSKMYLNMLRGSPEDISRIVSAVSIRDITKALEPRAPAARNKVEESLPREVRQYTDLFLDDGMDNNDPLPPHRSGVDTKVRLIKDEQGRDKEVPWGPLYGMSREELLVLRKTLTDLLDKN